MDYGLEAMQSAIAQGKARGSNQPGSKLGYITWKGGEKKILRFLTNQVLSGEFAEWVITNNGKAASFLIDPAKGNFVEKYGGLTREYGTGQIIPPKLRKMGVAVAVRRREVPLGDGRTEVQDWLNIIEIDGQQFQAREFGIVKLAIDHWDNLFGVSARYDGICDRDYEIFRDGGDKNTKYKFAPIEPVDELRDPEAVKQYYGYGQPFDENNPQRFISCPQTIEQWADYYSSEDRAKFLLEPKAAQPQQQQFINPALVQPYGQPLFQQPAGTNTYTSGPPGAATYAAQTPSQTHNPAQPVVVQGPQVGQYPQPQSQQAPPVPPPAPPSFPPINPPQGGNWGGQADEAQAAPSTQTAFADLRSTLMPNLPQQPAE